MEPTGRRAFLGALAGTMTRLAGCSAPGNVGAGTAPEASTGSPAAGAPPPAASVSPPVPWSFEKLREEVRSGGPPKDGIPSIDEPTFVAPAEVPSWLNDAEVVFGYAGEDDVKAYPQKVLVWHEICNDVLDGTSVSVSYCPLTGTVLVFERGATTFGVSGDLLNNNLVMYDRATDSRWPQMLATAIEGSLRGQALRSFGLVWTTWGRWRRAFPETQVLSTDTGYVRDYGGDPYGDYDPRKGYYAGGATLFGTLHSDDRLPLKRVVHGTRSRDDIVAFDRPTLREAGSLTTTVSGTRFLAVHDAPLDAAYVYRNGDSDVTVERIRDGQATLSTGETHPVDDLPLPRVFSFDSMWFAWAGFYPDTALVGGSEATPTPTETPAGNESPDGGAPKNPGGESR